MGFHGILRGFHGISWDFKRISWDFMGFHNSVRLVEFIPHGTTEK
jgi:hypothetical protein